VKYRSPLFTLAGLVVAFAIMFGVNLANSAPRVYKGAEPAATTTTAAPSSSTAPSSEPPAASESPSASPSPSASETTTSTKPRAYPDRVVYAGHTKDGSAGIAVAVLGDRTAAYFCDGRSIESWLRGRVTADTVNLKSKRGAKLKARLDGSVLRGTIRVGGKKATFAIKAAKKPAGLYRARGSKTTIGWIVLPDGSQVGVRTTGNKSVPAPKLDPGQAEVTVNGEQLTAEPVSGDQDV
jgi:hypothetical protein